ncbi:MAG: SAF domain-containing protein, partial [Pseudomonadota bacterium]
LRGEATGQSRHFHGDVVCVAKKNLKPGDVLDGEGGYTIWGRAMPAADSLSAGALPIGLGHGCAVRQPVAKGAVVRWQDVAVSEDNETVRLRRDMETEFRPAG